MKEWSRKLITMVLTLSMVLSMVPATVFATESTEAGDTVIEETVPEKIEVKDVTVAAKTWPEGEEKPADLTIRTANLYLPNQSKQMRVRIEMTGPEELTGFSVRFNGENRDYGASSNGKVYTVFYDVPNYTADSWYNFTMDIATSSGTVTYEQVALSTYLGSQEKFPLSYEDMDRPPEYVYKSQETNYPTVYYPVGTVLDDYSANQLSMKMVKDGVVYAASSSGNQVNINGAYHQGGDPRYQGLFQDPNYDSNHFYSYKQIGTSLYRARALEVGSYDVQVCDTASGKLLVTFANAVKVVDKPVVSVTSYLSNTHCSNLVGATTAYAGVEVYGGQPDEFTVSLYTPDGTKVGTSDSKRVVAERNDGFGATYYIPLKDGYVLEKDVTYKYEVTYAGADGSTDFYKRSNGTLRLSDYPSFETKTFGSRYYANFLFQVGNTDLDTRYKFELKENGVLLGTAYAYPDENGTCDVAFNNADGTPIPLKPQGEYTIVCYYISPYNGNWQQSSSQTVRNYMVQEIPELVSTMSLEPETTEEPLVMNGSEAYGNAEDGAFSGYLYVYSDDDNFAVFSDTTGHRFTIRMTNVAGGDSVEFDVNYTAKSYDDGNLVRYDLTGNLPADLLDGHYFFELYHNGVSMVNATGKNLMDDNYPDMPSRLPGIYNYAQDWLGMRFIYGFDPDNAAGARQARTDFYALGNNGIQPDLSYVWSDVSSWYLTPGIIDQINHHVPYICVSYLDGKVAGVITEYQYLMPKDMHDALSDQYYDGDIDTCEVSLSESAMAAEHGTFTLVSPFTGTGGEVPLYTEVYINAVPDEGYRLKPGSLKVNGEAIMGRAFLATEDATVTGEFELAPVEKYSVKMDSFSNGSVSVDKNEYAAGETVIVTVKPDEGYKIDQWTKPYYRTGNSSQTTMTDIGEGKWSFTMPSTDVTIYARFSKLSTNTIRMGNYNSNVLKSIQFTDEEGNVITLGSTQVTEGTTVYVDMVIGDDYLLKNLNMSRYDENNNYLTTPLEMTDVPGRYCFVMNHSSPYFALDYEKKIAYSVYCDTYGTVNGSFEVSGSSAYPGEEITVYPSPEIGYTVDRVYYEDGSGVTHTVTANANGAWAFVMPAANVTVYVSFSQVTGTYIYTKNNDIGTYTFSDQNGNPIDITAGPVEKGTVVYVKAETGSQYELNNIYYIDSYGYYTYLTSLGNGSFYFTMPDFSVVLYLSYTEKVAYSVACPAYANGSVSANVYSAYPGDTVSITVTPDSGYRVSRLYYMSDWGDVIDISKDENGNYTFIMPWSNVTINCEFEPLPAEAAGGNVASVTDLLFAMGGTNFASMSGNTVTLHSDMTLTNALVVTGGELTLNLNGFSIETALSGSDAALVTAPIQVTGGKFTLTNEAWSMSSISTGLYTYTGSGESNIVQHTIWVSGGALDVTGNLFISSDEAMNADAHTALLYVTGGQVELGEISDDETTASAGLSFEAMGCSEVLCVEGGSLTVNNGYYKSDYRMVDSGTTDYDEDFGNTERVSGMVVHVTKTGSLTIENGAFKSTASADTVHLNGTTGKVVINGGDFSSGTGTALYVSTGSNNSIDLTITKGAFDYNCCDCCIELPNGTGLKDYMAEGSIAISNAHSANPELMDEAALGASTYYCAVSIDKPLDIEVVVEGKGTVAMEPEQALPGSNVYFRPQPELGYVVSSFRYTVEGSDDEFVVEPSNGEYPIYAVRQNLKVYVTFDEVPEAALLSDPRFSLNTGYWSGQVTVPAAVINQVQNLHWNKTVMRIRLGDAQGNEVMAQECSSSPSNMPYMNVYNPGDLEEGRYKMYLTMADEYNEVALGYQWITLSDIHTYGANLSRSLSISTTDIDGIVYLETLSPTKLPDDLTLDLIDRYGNVIASAQDYDIRYYGNEKGGTAANNDADGEDLNRSTLMFHLMLEEGVLDTSNEYSLRLTSDSIDLMSAYHNTYCPITHPAFYDQVFNPITMVWSAKADNLPAGIYTTFKDVWNSATQTNERVYGPNLVVDSNATATMTFREWPFDQPNSGSVWLNIITHEGTQHGFDVSYWDDTSGGNKWYQPEVSNGVYVSYSGDMYYDYVVPYPIDENGETQKDQTVSISIPGYTGGGNYSVSCSSNNMYINGRADDLSSFDITIPSMNVLTHCNYVLNINTDDGQNNMSTLIFQFQTRAAVGRDRDFYGDIYSDFVTVYLSQPMGKNEQLVAGYTGLGSYWDLPFTITNGTIVKLDVSSIPVGQWTPVFKAYVTDENNGMSHDVDLVCGNWRFIRYSPVGELDGLPAVQKLMPEMDKNGVVTAQVRYDGQTPEGDVTMSVYRLNKNNTLVYHDSVTFSGSSYTISSDALNLAGDYVFYFALADGTVFDAQQASFGSSNIYTVKFLDYNGIVLSEQEVAYGASAIAPADPYREDYQFTGWSTGFDNITRDTAVYATYKKTNFFVYFYTNDGLNGSFKADKETGLVMRPADPVYDGHVFLGWSSSPNGTDYWDFDVDTVDGDTNLYACWETLPFEIHVIGKDASILVPSKSEAFAGDVFTVTVVEDAIPEGSSVTGIRMELDGGTSEYLSLGGTYVMPGRNVTLFAVVEAIDADLSINFTFDQDDISLDYINVWLYRDGNSYYADGSSGTATFHDLRPGEYYMDVSYGGNGFSNYEYMPINLDSGFNETSVSLYVPVCLSGTVTNFADGWLEIYDEWNNYCTGTYVGSDGSFAAYHVKPGTYTLKFWSNNGSYIPVISGGTVTVGEASVSGHRITLADTADLIVSLETDEANPAFQAYFGLYKADASGDYVWCNGLTVGAEDLGYLESAIGETGSYKLSLENLYASNYSWIEFESADVVFDVTQEQLKSGVIEVTLNYTYPAKGDLSDLSGSGNMAFLDRNTAFPGELVNLTIRYQNNGRGIVSDVAFEPVFDGGLEVYSGYDADFGVGDLYPGGHGSLTVPVRVSDHAEGTLFIDVNVNVGGESVLFDTVSLNVSAPTLAAPAQAVAGETFVVSGQAAPGKTVFIKNADTSQMVAVAKTTGTFYSAEITAKEGTLNLVAVVGEARSKTATVQIIGKEETPLTVTRLNYNGTNAKWSDKLNAYTFWQYVDMELMGSALQIELDFNQTGEDIGAVKLGFCGKSVMLSPDSMASNTFRAEKSFVNWGGSGLKPITAEITMADGTVIEMIVAYVNLLIDPSGVVTDAVTGEPLEGVTVILQVFDHEKGMWMNWDAESSGQTNPVITDSEGKYGWMVPEGTYRVLASKDGYEDYNSQPQFGDLLVPPPRSDVNFSMIPAGDPRVISIEISEKGTLIADKFTAKPGELVSVAGIPDDAYMLVGIRVMDSNGKSVKVIKNDKSYEFAMPSSDVEVSGLYAAKASASVAVAVQEGEITASALNLNEAAVLVIAQYDGEGRMINIKFGTEKQDRLTVSVAKDCVEAKAFLLDGASSMRPISGAATCPVKK